MIHLRGTTFRIDKGSYTVYLQIYTPIYTMWENTELLKKHAVYKIKNVLFPKEYGLKWYLESIHLTYCLKKKLIYLQKIFDV